MDISLPIRNTAPQHPVSVPPPSSSETARNAASPALVVTDAHVDALDTTESIPDSALRRDDALGRLFAAAFTLPAPPMPAFPAS